MQRWSRDSIIDAIRYWADLRGDPPTSRDCNRNAELPSVETIRHHFKNLNDALVHAGYRPRPRGIPGHLILLERDRYGRLQRQ